jgi:hypothetical protein
MSDLPAKRETDVFTPGRFALLLAALVFAAYPQVVLGLQTFVIRDFGFFVHPLAFFQRECFWRGELPFWNPYLYCGAPFLAQWNTMPLYPPALVYVLLPLTWGLGMFCLLHVWWAGLGMFFLTRRWTGNNFAAAFAGTMFAFNGFTLNLIMWPSHLATFAWMPWVVFAVEGAWQNGGRKIFLAGIVGAMQMLAGGPEIILFTWVVLLALWVQQFLRGETRRFAMTWRCVPVVLLVLVLAAIQLLPFLDLVAHSQRNLNYHDTRWSLPGRGWVNFLVPMAFGNTWDMGVFYQYGQEWTSSIYLGIGGLWLAVLAFAGGRTPRIRLLCALAAVAFVFAMGENGFVLPALQKVIPQLHLITHSIKYIAIVIFIAPLLAALALARRESVHRLELANTRSQLFISGFVLFLTFGGILVWAGRFPLPHDDVPRTMFNGVSRLVFLAVNFGLLLSLTLKLDRKFHLLLSLLLIMASWLDVLTHEPAQNPTVQPLIYEPGLSKAKLNLHPQPALGESRAMITPTAFMTSVHFASHNVQNNYLVNRLVGIANCNLLDDVPKTDGFLSVLPVTADDLNSLLYVNTNANYPRLEDFMGVSQITAADKTYNWQSRSTYLPLVTAGQKPLFPDELTAFYGLAKTNFEPAKTVYIQPDAKSLVTVTNQTDARVLNSKFGTQTVDADVEAVEPSMVVVAQTYYHDWHAYVDGQSVPLLRANYAFQAVQVPAGKHHLHLAYEDAAFRRGAWIALIVWPICLLALLVPRFRLDEIFVKI